MQCSKVNETDNNVCDKPWMSSMMFQRVGLTNAAAVVDVSQVGLLDEHTTLYVHTAKDERQTLDAFEAAALWSGDLSVGYAYNTPDAARGLPPSPALAFLREKPTLPAVVIADHEFAFTNKNYHSHLDHLPINTTALCEVATLVARTLYALASGGPDTTQTLAADCSLVSQLVECLTYDFKCKLVAHYLGALSNNDPSNLLRVSGYTGVFGKSATSVTVHARSKFLRVLLTDLVSLHRGPSCNKTSDCAAFGLGYQCIGVKPNATCIKGATVFHDALSLGIAWDPDKEKWYISDPTQPLWTES